MNSAYFGPGCVIIGIILIVLIMLFVPFGFVGAGERGVTTNWGAVQDSIKGEGMYWRTPIMQTIHIIDIKTQKIEVDSSAASKDMQTVNAKVALNYHPVPDQVNKLYQTIGTEYAETVIHPAIQETIKSITAQFTAEELITKREEVRNNIKQNLTEKLAPKFIAVDDLNIINFDFGKEFNDAIEAKQVAQQNVEKAKNDLARIEIEKEQAVAQAQGRAEALKIEGEALKSEPQIAQLRFIEKWNGIMPTYYGAATPFIGLNPQSNGQ